MNMHVIFLAGYILITFKGSQHYLDIVETL